MFLIVGIALIVVRLSMVLVTHLGWLNKSLNQDFVKYRMGLRFVSFATMDTPEATCLRRLRYRVRRVKNLTCR